MTIRSVLVYDMYPWDKTATRRAEDASPDRRPTPSATHAVQVALDRRDNGGDAAGGPSRQ